MDEKQEQLTKLLQKPIYEEKPNDREKEINESDEHSVTNTVSTVDKQQSEPSLPLSNTDLHLDHLSEVPVEYSVQLAKEVKDQVKELKEVHEEPSICTSGPTVQLQTRNQMQVPDGSSRIELSPTSVSQSISSISIPTQPQREQVINGSNACITEEEKNNSPRPRLPSAPIQKVPSDGYNWRKYGQKQVKIPEGSRSYYRCTFSDCCAKKIECSDRSNCIVETVYRSHHNHDPPQILNCNRERKPVLRMATLGGISSVTGPLRAAADLVSCTSKEHLPGIDKIPETKKQESSSSDETMEVNAKDMDVDRPESKKRQKRTSPDELGSLPKSRNKPKFVVHAAGDEGVSGDGYRWRKYGQKMVKGNPHPRNYYRCTSAGCPVRKQIERAVDSTSALIITYKGGHNHDMPVPKKRHVPKSAPNSSTPSVPGGDLQIDTNETHQSLTQHLAEKEGKATGESLDLGGNRTTEPARTLLGVGIEVKPC